MFTCIEKDPEGKEAGFFSYITYQKLLATGLTFASHCLLEEKRRVFYRK